MGESELIASIMKPRLLNLPPPESRQAPVFGISEWQNYYVGNEPGIDTPAVIDECVELHRTLGISGMVWEAGRATINYHSELPHTTRQWELGQSDKGPNYQGFSRQFAADIMNRCCPLRRGIRLCRERNLSILGRLSMNRHYGGAKNIGSTSRFSIDHPEWIEIGKCGEPIRTRMCYAIPEVRQERLDILLEVQRIGVDALVLDFCRQMPILGYHDAVVQPFLRSTGVDPRRIDTDNPDDYREWFAYRAGILTDFMRTLRRETGRQAQQLGRDCPIVARIPDYTGWLSVACGFDVEAWFREDLVDATMLSPFPRVQHYLEGDPDYHVACAHRHGKPCIGGVGHKGLIANPNGPVPFGDLPDVPIEYVCKVADRQYRAGVDAMSLYQSESLTRRDYLQPLIRHLGDKDWIADKAVAVETPTPDHPHFYVGKDWHSRPEEGLTTALAGNLAL